MIWRFAAEVLSLRMSLGANGRTTLPSASTTSRTTWGWKSLPPLATAA